MARHNGTTADELYHPHINLRSKKIVIPAAIAVGIGGVALVKTLIGDIGETKKEANIRQPAPIVDTRPAPKPPELQKVASSRADIENYMQKYNLSGNIESWQYIIDRINTMIPNQRGGGKYIKHGIRNIRDEIGKDGVPIRTVYVDVWKKDFDGVYKRSGFYSYKMESGKWVIFTAGPSSS